MSEVLHLIWKYFTLFLKQRITPLARSQSLHIFWGTTGKEKRRKEASTSTFALGEECAPLPRVLIRGSSGSWLMSPALLLALLPALLRYSFNFHPKSGSASSAKKAQRWCEGNKREMQILVLPDQQEIWTVSTEMAQRAVEMKDEV